MPPSPPVCSRLAVGEGGREPGGDVGHGAKVRSRYAGGYTMVVSLIWTWYMACSTVLTTFMFGACVVEQFLAIDQLPVLHNGIDLLGVADILHRICVQDEEIRYRTLFD